MFLFSLAPTEESKVLSFQYRGILKYVREKLTFKS
jgi:hypothetical protein